MKKNVKIAIAGAHGTGKTTLAKIISSKLNISTFGSLRTRWSEFGISNFELLPPDIRTKFQLKMIISQIDMETEAWNSSFVLDRSVIDYLAFTLVSSDMSGDELTMFTYLIRERVQKYDFIIYTPIEFEVENEALRANIEIRDQIDQKIFEYISKWVEPEKLIIAKGTIEERLNQIKRITKIDI